MEWLVQDRRVSSRSNLELLENTNQLKNLFFHALCETGTLLSSLTISQGKGIRSVSDFP